MKTFYLVDFENVHNEGLENIDTLTTSEHVHIFSTKKALNIRMDFVCSERIAKAHIVPVRSQSLDMHLVSYLGYLLGVHGKKCTYIIVSKDTDYDNIIQFWKDKGYSNISRRQKISETTANKKKNQQSHTVAVAQTANGKNSAGFSGSERSKLNIFMQRGLVAMGYSGDDVNQICKYVVAHCNDERMLNGIHNDLKNEYSDYREVYEDVKIVLEKYKSSKSKSKKELQVRSFFGQHFRERLYLDNKEEIIRILMTGKTKQRINNDLMKLYADGKAVKHIYQTVQPLIKDLPGK